MSSTLCRAGSSANRRRLWIGPRSPNTTMSAGVRCLPIPWVRSASASAVGDERPAGRDFSGELAGANVERERLTRDRREDAVIEQVTGPKFGIGRWMEADRRRRRATPGLASTRRVDRAAGGLIHDAGRGQRDDEAVGGAVEARRFGPSSSIRQLSMRSPARAARRCSTSVTP